MANFNLNKVILGGRIASDVSLAVTPGGVSYVRFTLAVTRRGANGETDFITVSAWRQTAEFITRYFTKGNAICVTGAIRTDVWEDREGHKRHSVSVIADEAYFVDSKGDSASAVDDQTAVSCEKKENFEAVDENEELPF